VVGLQETPQGSPSSPVPDWNTGVPLSWEVRASMCEQKPSGRGSTTPFLLFKLKNHKPLESNLEVPGWGWPRCSRFSVPQRLVTTAGCWGLSAERSARAAPHLTERSPALCTALVGVSAPAVTGLWWSHQSSTQTPL